MLRHRVAYTWVEVGAYYYGLRGRFSNDLEEVLSPFDSNKLAKSAHFLLVMTNYNAERWANNYIQEIIRLHDVPIYIISD